jgi:GR25 family glycosyltransferase involved in LPS biosynthesis
MDNLNKIGNIYVCHYTPLKERKENMISQCKKYNLINKLVFIEDYDRENLDQEVLTTFNTKYIPLNINIGLYPRPERGLKLCEISLFMKHLRSMFLISKSNYNWGIIMEDDVIFKDDFDINLNKILEQLPTDFDILYTGFFPFIDYFRKVSAIDNPIPKGVEKIGYFYNMSKVVVFPHTFNNKGSDFYIISKNCCKKILNYIKKVQDTNNRICNPIDMFLGNYLFNTNSNVYWTDLVITLHGSWDYGLKNTEIFNNSMIDRPKE